VDERKIRRIERLGSFVLGGIAGAAAGVLLAPRSGRETRGAMSSRAGEARQSGREGYFEARERARERLAGMREPRRVDEDTAEMRLGPQDEAHSEDVAPEEHPGLRAVPREEPEAPEEPVGTAEPGGEPDGDSEDLRRRIRHTRDRLRRRGGPET